MECCLLSLGHGYAGRATEAALPAGWRLRAASRAPGAQTRWPEDAAEALAEATHLISWVAPGPEGDPILPLLANLAAPRLRWIGYASAASTWGDFAGGWVDEDTPVAPGNARGLARLTAEEAWQRFADAHGLPLARLRIAGIYGPGRSALDALRAGTARRIAKPGQVFNRIHAHDLGRIAIAAAEARLAGPLILTDHDPAPPGDPIAFAAALLGLPCPPEIPFETAGLSPMGRSFYAENKRLRSRRVGPELGVDLLYPSYREGLTAIWNAGG